MENMIIYRYQIDTVFSRKKCEKKSRARTSHHHYRFLTIITINTAAAARVHENKGFLHSHHTLHCSIQ